MDKSELLKKVWPQWEIVRELGEGAFGSVYEVQRKDIGGTFKAALKFMSIPKSQKEIQDAITEGMDETTATSYFRSIMEDLVKEFATMEMLKGNTNIVSYEDHVVVEHENEIGWDILIRMELLTPFKDYLQSHPMDEKTVIKIGRDICSALVICEKRNIVHRDIKMENVFVSEYGDFKLGDFGVARTVEKTTSGMSIKGTISYMAPEVYKGQQYNSSVDMYSLGILLYRLANNNRSPFLPPAPAPISYTDKENAEMRRLAGERFPDASMASPELMSIIRKATAYNADARYKSASEMRDDLAKWALGKEPVAFEEDKKAVTPVATSVVTATATAAANATAATTATVTNAAASVAATSAPNATQAQRAQQPVANAGVQQVQVQNVSAQPQMQQAGGYPQQENSGVYVQPQMQQAGGYPQQENSGVYAQPQMQQAGGYPQQENSGVYVQPQMQYAQPAQQAEQPAKKKPKLGLILGLSLGALGLLLVIGAIVIGVNYGNSHRNDNQVVSRHNNDDDDDDDDDSKDPVVDPEPEPDPDPEPEPDPDPEPVDPVVDDPVDPVDDEEYKYHASIAFETIYGEKKEAFSDEYTYLSSDYSYVTDTATVFDGEFNEDGYCSVSIYGLDLMTDCFTTLYVQTDIPISDNLEFKVEYISINGNEVSFSTAWCFTSEDTLCVRLEDSADYTTGTGAYNYFGITYPNVTCSFDKVSSIYIGITFNNIGQ